MTINFKPKRSSLFISYDGCNRMNLHRFLLAYDENNIFVSNFKLMKIVLLYFLLINTTAFILAGYDKYLAIKSKSRISENTLFLSAALGGSAGLVLAMLLFRHKISKTSFILKFAIIILIQLLIFLKWKNKI